MGLKSNDLINQDICVILRMQESQTRGCLLWRLARVNVSVLSLVVGIIAHLLQHVCSQTFGEANACSLMVKEASERTNM